MRHLDCPWYRDIVQEDIRRRKLEKIRVSDIHGVTLYTDQVQRYVRDISEHSPEMGDTFQNILMPTMIREELARPKLFIPYPNSKKKFLTIRLYPAFTWGGDWHYQHRWGWEAAEAYEVYMTRMRNRRRVGKQEHFEEMFWQSLQTYGGKGASVDIDEVVFNVLRQHPEYHTSLP